MHRPLVIFDFDGTICDTRPSIAQALSVMLRNQTGEHVEPNSLYELIGRGFPLRQTILELAPQLPDERIKNWADDYENHYTTIPLSEIIAFDGVVETIERISRVADVAVASNKGQAALEHALEHLELSRFIQSIYGDDGCSPQKPSAELFTRRIRPDFPQAEPATTLMVGDSKTDMMFAANCAIKSCWVSFGFGTREETRSIGYDFEIDHFPQILTVVESL